MGCDIHLILEYKYKGQWVGVHDFGSACAVSHYLFHSNTEKKDPTWSAYWRAQGRNYRLFASLAGVRGEGPKPNGLPADISPLAEYAVTTWGEDGHSHCHYTLRECGTHFMSEYAPKMLFSKERVTWLANFFGLNPGIPDDEVLDNARLIIFFDN